MQTPQRDPRNGAYFLKTKGQKSNRFGYFLRKSIDFLDEKHVIKKLPQ
jgi:hypothetical protein